MRNFTLYVKNEFGLHARPCLILATLHKHYFSNTDIFVVDLPSGNEANMASVMELMKLAAMAGNPLEFMTMLDPAGFDSLREILLLLTYIQGSGGMIVKTSDCYEQCIQRLANHRADLATLKLKLELDAAKENVDYFFSTDRPSDMDAPLHTPELKFSFGKGVLNNLARVAPDFCDDAIKVAEYLSRRDPTGLVLIRRLIEHLVKEKIIASGVRVPANAPLAERIKALADHERLRKVDHHFLTMFRMLGNEAVHGHPISDAILLPDQEIAYYVFKIFENLLKELIVR